MMKHTFALLAALTMAAFCSGEPVRTASGLVEGSSSADGSTNIYKGIPFAAAPVGDLRWKPPQPVAPWQGVRKATEFGARCMQGDIFKDMVFRDSGPSEDCLYLNVWAPAHSDGPLPVMVWIYGGGFQAGAASEPRQDGERLTHKGVVVVSMNYRLGIFGFMALPELAKESGHNAAGNYGLLDQLAALKWVHENIKAFGGDPNNVTIFGESAGSMSVNAQVTSPLSAGLFKQAIGESGGLFGMPSAIPPLKKSEENGISFAKQIGAPTLQELRAKPADELLADALKNGYGFRFWPNVDGYFFPESPLAIYQGQKENRVAVLAGWNQDEMSAEAFFGKKEPTRENFDALLKQMFGAETAKAAKLFPAADTEEMKRSAGELAGARFISYSTWKWLEFEAHTPGVKAYRYHFEEAPPVEGGGPSRGAYHSADIEYVFETLDWKKLPSTEADKRVSEQISSYWTNFAKTGNPNGTGLPNWPQYAPEEFQVMHLGANTEAAPDKMREQYLLLNSIAQKPMATTP